MGTEFLFSILLFFNVYLCALSTNPSGEKLQTAKFTSTSSSTGLRQTEHFADQFFADFEQNLVGGEGIKKESAEIVMPTLNFDKSKIDQLMSKFKNGWMKRINFFANLFDKAAEKENAEVQKANLSLKGQEKWRRLAELKDEYAKSNRQLFAVNEAVDAAAIGILIAFFPFMNSPNSPFSRPIGKEFFDYVICALIGNELSNRLAQVRLRIGIGPASKMSEIWEKSEKVKVNENKWPVDGIKTSIYYVQNWLENDEQIILGTSSNWFTLLQKCVENYPNRKINGETFSDNLNFYIFFYEKLSEFCSKLVGHTDKAELRKLWAKYDSFLGAALEEFNRAQNIIANSGIEQAKVKMCH